MTTIDFSQNISKEQIENAGNLVILKGEVTLKGVEFLKNNEYKCIDLSLAEFGTEEEEYAVCLGYGHCGPVYGAYGVRKIEVLKRLLESITAEKVILPDNIAKRHINCITRNERIVKAHVNETCKLFSMVGNDLYNKKKDKLVFKSRL